MRVEPQSRIGQPPLLCLSCEVSRHADCISRFTEHGEEVEQFCQCVCRMDDRYQQCDPTFHHATTALGWYAERATTPELDVTGAHGGVAL